MQVQELVGIAVSYTHLSDFPDPAHNRSAPDSEKPCASWSPGGHHRSRYPSAYGYLSRFVPKGETS